MEYLITLLTCFTLAATLSLPRDDFRQISYQDLQFNIDSFSQNGITTYSQLLFDVARNQVLIGARDVLLRLSLSNLKLLENATWISPEDKTSMCLAKGQSEENCHNYIKVLLTNGKKVFTCGTESFSPSCTWRNIENINTVTEKLDGVAKCPFNPLSNITAVLTHSGEYYVGGPTDFSGSDFAIYRTTGYRNSIRTKQYNSMWLNEPQFVGSFEHDKFIYFLFREAAVEYINCGKIVYSRIARVCKNDAGGQVMLKDNWTTFVKARLNCSVAGDYPFYYDEIQSMSYVAEQNVLYATFTTPSNSIAGSAICAFNISAINKAFAGAFKYQQHVGSAWSKHYSENHNHFECMALPHRENLIESSKYQLMDSAVQAITLKPLHEAKLERFTHITVDVISTKIHSSLHVIFVATQDGLIKKLSVLPRIQETCIVEVWNLSPDTYRPLQILSMQFLKDTNSLYMGTTFEVLKIPAHHCSRHVSKDSCLNAMDPYCGWYDLNDTCIVAPNSDPLDKYWKQSVTSCPILDAPIDGGWSSWSEWFSCLQKSTSIDYDSGDECICQKRQCNNPTPQNGGESCDGHTISVANCTVHGGWTSWSAWSECSATCGVAVKTRTRTCTNPAPAHRGRVCVGQDRSEVLCTGNPPCPVAIPTPQDGGWSDWDGWSPCSATCGAGFKRRERSCNSPLPLSGGLECIGSNVEYETCNVTCQDHKKVSTININYTNNKNEFIQHKIRFVCKAPVINSSAIKLNHKEEVCKDRECGNDTHWGPWSDWGSCTTTCGVGTQRRERRCETRNCEGHSFEERKCYNQNCLSVNDEWGCWSDWSPCSATCGWGIQKRFRNCLPSGSGFGCSGKNMQEQQCQGAPCGSLLGWDDWTVWSECDKYGEQHRKRNCRTLNPGPQICQGPSKETRICINASDQCSKTSEEVSIMTASGLEILAYISIGIVFGFGIGLLCHYVYTKRRKTKIPSSPHYMSAKANPYITIPLHKKPMKRQSVTNTNVLNNTQNGTLKSVKYEYDTIKRNSHGLNNASPKIELLDEFYN